MIRAALLAAVLLSGCRQTSLMPQEEPYQVASEQCRAALERSEAARARHLLSKPYLP